MPLKYCTIAFITAPVYFFHRAIKSVTWIVVNIQNENLTNAQKVISKMWNNLITATTTCNIAINNKEIS